MQEGDETAHAMERHVLWSCSVEPGLEHLHLVQTENGVLADGLLIAVEKGLPFRARYRIQCDTAWRVRKVDIELLDGEKQQLHLTANGQWRWTTAAGHPIPALDGCLDVDMSVTPFTNTLPIRRLALAVGETAEITVAYVKVPQLQVTAAQQRYTHVVSTTQGEVYMYEGLDTGFQAELTVDQDGLVLEYPQIWRRV